MNLRQSFEGFARTAVLERTASVALPQLRRWGPITARLGGLVAAVTFGLAPTVAFAQPAPKVSSLSETWLTRGTTNRLTISGEALADVAQVIVSGSGITASLAPVALPSVSLAGAHDGVQATPVPTVNARELTLVLDPGLEPGPRALRLAGPSGVSNPLSFEVSEWTELREAALVQSTPAPGIPVLPVPAAVSGVIGQAAEADWYEFPARRGERLIVDVQANRVGSPLDATLVLFDRAGNELARSEDAHGLDPFLEFTAPEDGDYTVKLFDLRFQGGADYRYRLVLGPLPYLDFLFPFGGRRGETVPVRMEGRNLGGAETMNFEIRPDAPLGRRELRAKTALGSSNPLPFDIGTWPEIADREPNDTLATAQAITAPVSLNGRLGRTNDVDYYRWRARADEKTVVEVLARPFGSALDALLTVSDAQGAVVGQNDDANGPDARVVFDAKANTDYVVALRDLTDRGGSRFGYRLVIQPEDTTPNFVVRVAEPRVRVPRGGSTAVRCEIERRQGYDGVVRVSAEDLPAGVTASPVILSTAGAKFGWLILTAQTNAALGFQRWRLTAAAEMGGRATQRAVETADDVYLAVLPEVPFRLDVSQALASVDQAGTFSLDVTVSRREDFPGEVKVVAEDVPGVSFTPLTLAGDQARGKISGRLAYNAETGAHPVALRAEATVGGRAVMTHAPVAPPVMTEGIPLFIVAMLPGSSFFLTNPVKLSATALPEGSASVANQTEFVVKVDRRGLAGEIPLQVEGLPAGISITSTNLAANSNEAGFRLVVSDRAPLGTNHQFRVAATVTHQNRIWRQVTEPITLMITAPEPVAAPAAGSNTVATAAGR